ncbi:MAG: protease complex subunit PrcB family protein [Vicinamibacterales bacterium]
MRAPAASVLLALSVVTAGSVVPSRVAAQPPIAMRSVEHGDQSNIDEAREVVIRSQAEWEALWRQHSPDRTRPVIDFGKETVVGVFLGSRTTAGFAVTIVDVATRDAGLVARYTVTRPAAGAVTAQVLVFPYHLVAVPSRAGEVRFERVEPAAGPAGAR